MQITHRYEADIDYCPQCKGVWLDRGEIDKIANVQSRYENAHYQKYHYGRGEYDMMITIKDEEEREDFLVTCLILIKIITIYTNNKTLFG